MTLSRISNVLFDSTKQVLLIKNRVFFDWVNNRKLERNRFCQCSILEYNTGYYIDLWRDPWISQNEKSQVDQTNMQIERAGRI